MKITPFMIRFSGESPSEEIFYETYFNLFHRIAVAAFIICTIYIRAKTNYRVDYPGNTQFLHYYDCFYKSQSIFKKL